MADKVVKMKTTGTDELVLDTSLQLTEIIKQIGVTFEHNKVPEASITMETYRLIHWIDELLPEENAHLRLKVAAIELFNATNRIGKSVGASLVERVHPLLRMLLRNYMSVIARILEDELNNLDECNCSNAQHKQRLLKVLKITNRLCSDWGGNDGTNSDAEFVVGVLYATLFIVLKDNIKLTDYDMWLIDELDTLSNNIDCSLYSMLGVASILASQLLTTDKEHVYQTKADWIIHEPWDYGSFY